MTISGNEIQKPAWLTESQLAFSLDAREMLARGEHPLTKVMELSSGLLTGQIFELITPFLPQPLIDKVGAGGFESYSVQVSPAEIRSYFIKK